MFVETVKDLIRFLKREDESCDIRRQLGHAQILQNDLIPILKTYKDDRILWETVIRLDLIAVCGVFTPTITWTMFFTIVRMDSFIEKGVLCPVKVCLHATTLSSKSKFNIVSIVADTLTGKMGCTPILSVKKIKW